MKETNPNSAICWTVMVGDPFDGFNLYGTYATAEEAIDAAEENTSRSENWWVMPINSME